MSNKFSLFLALIAITSFSNFTYINAEINKSLESKIQNKQDSLKFSNIWARASLSPNPNSAIYLDITNDSNDQYTLIGASAMSVTDNVEIHQSFQDEKGVIRMAPIDNIVIPAHTTISLKPAGMHLMLLDLKKNLNPDDQFELTLKFKESFNKILSVSVHN